MEFDLTIEEVFNLKDAMVDLIQPSELANSHEVIVNTQITYTDISIVANDYWYYVNSGRGRSENSNTPPQVRPAIDNWISKKNLPTWYKKNGKPMTKDEQAFLITRKIHRDGYRGNFYADKTAPLYQDAIDKAIFEDIQNYFNNEFSK
jgi:hypothetical protein